MAIVQMFRNIQVSPRVSFWISVFSLSFVLFNNHVVMTRVDAQEKAAHALMEQNINEQKTLARRERLLRAWESELINREREFSAFLKDARRGRSPQQDEIRD